MANRWRRKLEGISVVLWKGPAAAVALIRALGAGRPRIEIRGKATGKGKAEDDGKRG